MRRSLGAEFVAGLLLALSTLFSSAACADMPTTLRVGLLPGEAALTVIRINEPLRTHLERRLGMPVELVVAPDYAATGEALRFGRLDVAYLGPVSYVLQRQKAEIVPFATPRHPKVGAVFQAAII